MCALADEVVGWIIYITGLVYIKYSLSTARVGVMLYMYPCTVLLPPGDNPIAINKYIYININFLYRAFHNDLRDYKHL